MKKTNALQPTKILLIFALVFSNFIQAQNFTLMLNPLKPIGQKNLFDLSLVNNTNYGGSVTLIAKLRNESGTLLMTQQTSKSIAPNSMAIIGPEQENISTNIVDFQFQKMYAAGNGLPPLNYVLCVEVHASENRNLVTEECIDFLASEVLSIFPVYPADEDLIFEQRPPLQWMLAGSQIEQFTYNLRLARVDNDENPNRSLRRNQLLINQKNIMGTGINFPLDAPELEMGKKYAWQVDVVLGGDVVMKSDIWVFTVEDSKKYVDIPRNLSYVEFAKIAVGTPLYAVGSFKFKYVEEYRENKLKIELFDKEKEGKEYKLVTNSLDVERGVNAYELPLSEEVYLKHFKSYYLKITEKNSGRSYKLTLLYVNPDYIK